MTRVGAAHQNRIQHKSSCAVRQRNMRNRQKNGVDEQRAEANIFNRNRHNEIHSFQQKNKVGTPMKQRFGLHIQHMRAKPKLSRVPMSFYTRRADLSTKK